MDLWKTELRDDGVFVAAYDNPPTNYFTGQATVELRELLGRWREPDVKAVVITGAQSGKYITHYSVEELVHGSAHPEELRRSFPENIAAWHTLLQNITYLDKAVVAGSRATSVAADSSSRSTATSASCSAVTFASASPSAPSGSSPARARRC
jgi:enoyl-CoA hydratase/carnithine racemase